MYSGEFLSPVATLFPGFLPEESEVARFELLLPHQWSRPHKPVFIHLAGTGDHYFWRRRYTMALPLLKEGGVGSLLLENPFYGSRKPKAQVRSQLQHVSDLLVMGLALILECHLLLLWLEGDGLGPVGLTGISMGGHNASLAAALHPKPLPVVPCLSWTTASCVFTKGVLSSAVCWEALERQLASDDDGALGRLFRGVVCEVAGREKPSASTATPPSAATRDPVSWGNVPTAAIDCSVVVAGQTGLPRTLLAPATRQLAPTADTLLTMEAVLDYSTHLRYFPVPMAPNLATFLVAKDDLYIPRDSVADVWALWPGCSVQYIEGGHVISCIAKQPHFRNALYNVLEKMAINHVA